MSIIRMVDAHDNLRAERPEPRNQIGSERKFEELDGGRALPPGWYFRASDRARHAPDAHRSNAAANRASATTARQVAPLALGTITETELRLSRRRGAPE
jgi:hypothetical protein